MPSIPGLITALACALAGLLTAVGLSRLMPDFIPGPILLLSIAVALFLWVCRERWQRFRERRLLLAEIDRLEARAPVRVSLPGGEVPLVLAEAEVAPATLRPQRSEPKLAMPVVVPDQDDMADADAQAEADIALFDAVREALTHNRVELHVQPIVQLPARRLRYVELLARARDAEGREISAASCLPALRAAGLAAEFNALMLMRGLQVARLLENRTRNLGFFCNMSGEVLTDPKAFAATHAFLQRERGQANGLILEFAAADLRDLDAEGWQRVARFAALNYPLSVDGFDTLQVDVAGLARRGFRFVKLDTALLLDDALVRKAPVALSDFAKLCARHEIEPVLAKVEREADLARLAELGFRLGQGHLFGQPKLANAA